MQLMGRQVTYKHQGVREPGLQGELPWKAVGNTFPCLQGAAL